MTALADFRDTQKRFHPAGLMNETPATDATAYFQGGLVSIVTATGKLVPSSDTAGQTATGRCEQTIVSGTGDGRTIRHSSGIFNWAVSGTAIGLDDIGKQFNVVDDQTLTIDATSNSIKGGVLYDIDADGVAWFTNLYPIPQA